MFSSVWNGFKWLLENLVLLLAFIGAASVVVRAFDTVVEKMIEKHPKARFWKYLDKALDHTDSVAGWLREIMVKIALNRTPGA